VKIHINKHLVKWENDHARYSTHVPVKFPSNGDESPLTMFSVPRRADRR